MERLHGPVNQCIFEEENVDGEVQHWSTSFDMEDNRPFLQMLQSADNETPSVFSSFAESSSSFQVLLKLQHQKRPWQGHYSNHLNNTSDESSKVEAAAISAQIQAALEPGSCASGRPPPPAINKRKRKRTRPAKNKEEIESHRMTHIAVERNRRRQMNDHLSELRSLMPPSYAQRGDQASIVGGAIDFIKELEQLLQSLQAEKRLRMSSSAGEGCENSISCSSSCSTLTTQHYEKKQDKNSGDNYYEGGGGGRFIRAERKSMVADVQVTLIHNHVNLKIECGKTPRQLHEALLALEGLRLTVLHLNVNSSETSSVHYSFSLRLEDDCRLRSAMEIAEAVHQIFRLINGSWPCLLETDYLGKIR